MNKTIKSPPDWSRFDAMTAAEHHAAAPRNPDALDDALNRSPSYDRS
jgi:hypothetical protein